MPDQPTESPASYVFLKLPCPRCQGRLEKRVVDKDKKADVRCSVCKAAWPAYKAVFVEAQRRVAGGGVSLDGIRKALVKTQAFARGGRNVASRLRAAKQKLDVAIEAVRSVKEKGAVDAIGDSVEGIIGQVILALDDLKDAKAGTVAPLADGEPAQEGEGEA